MKKMTAFVLGGGGARGALQVGALRALLEAGIKPDLLVGTSIGAANAAFIATRGFTREGIVDLVKTWHIASMSELLPANYLWLTIRTLFNRPREYSYLKIRDFLITNGLSPELRFGQIHGASLYVVATDLNGGCPVVFGKDSDGCVLEAVLASTALPPWVSPIANKGQLLMDGGMLSNLPIEPAISVGATEIIALDLLDRRNEPVEAAGFGPFFMKLINSVDARHEDLELAIARACDVPVLHVNLQGKNPVDIWDFSCTDDLITLGYDVTAQALAGWKPQDSSWLRKLFKG